MLANKKGAPRYGLNQFRIIVLPLAIAFIAIIGMSSLSYYISRGHLLNQTRSNGRRLASMLARQVSEVESINEGNAFNRQHSTYQALTENLALDEEIQYAFFLDESYRIIAGGTKTGLGMKDEIAQELEELTQGDFFLKPYYEIEMEKGIYVVAVPFQFKETDDAVVVIGFSLKPAYNAVFESLAISIGIGILMFILFYRVQRHNVIAPLTELARNIQMIDVEKDSNFRLPALNDGSFFELIDTINRVLDKAQDYFFRLRKKEIELNGTNQEISAAYEQLTATEEELRMQYDEIQHYLENLENLKQKYEIAIHGTGCAVWEINLSDMKIEFTQEFSTIVGYEANDRKDAKQAMEYLYEEDRSLFIDAYDKFLGGEAKEIYLQLRMKTVSNQLKWVLIRGTGIYDVRGKLRFINGIVMDITEMKKQEKYIQHLAFQDPLTELPNRRSFMKTLKKELKENACGAVMLLDLDNFKEINDSLGHVYGDEVLLEIANKLTAIAGEHFRISRFGGDEFLFLLLGTDSLIVIEDYIEQIRAAFIQDFEVAGTGIHINYSMGISRFPLDSQDENQLISFADTAMYHVKETGRNSYAFFNTDMLEKVIEKKEIETILRGAIRKKGFQVFYQPQIALRTREIASFEALIRIKNYQISPAEFIPIAEETGLIQEIGRWVTQQAVQQLVLWRNKGFDLKPIAINFSTRQLIDENYPLFLEELLKKNKIEARFIEIEITESILLERADETINYLNRLKAMGVKLALDDFGTGYSSLSYLTFIPVYKIKLDRSLNNKFLKMDDSKVIESLITLAHSLNLAVTAEGIEDEIQLDRLQTWECDFVQGYLFSRPLPAEEIEAIYHQVF